MIKIVSVVTYDPPSEKYFTNGFSSETDGKTTKWEVNEEIIMRAHALSKRRWNTIEEAIAEIKEHSAFRVKVKSTKPGIPMMSSFI